MQFQDLNLIEPILKALKQEGYTTPTPIQAQAIPLVLEGNDLLGCAQTYHIVPYFWIWRGIN